MTALHPASRRFLRGIATPESLWNPWQYLRVPVPPALGTQWQRETARSLERIRNSRWVITGLVRDSEHTVDLWRSKISRFASLVADYRVVILENDSQDQTRARLLEWARADSKVTILGGGINASESRLGLPDTSRNNECTPARIGKMAMLRNELHDFVKQLEAQSAFLPDLLWSIDLDKVGTVFFDGLATAAHRLLEHRELDALSCAGLDFKLAYYDTFALLFENENIENPEKYYRRVMPQKAALELLGHTNLIPVKSAYGGSTLYRWASFRDQRYSFSRDATLRSCEHSYFHAGKRVFIDPSFIFLFQ